MSIRSRIKSIENHLSNAYNSIINLGLYENNTNKNMENISPLLDEFYDKVSDKTDLNQNGVVGRTSQETITEEAGTNVINTSIYIDDVNTDKEHVIELKGNTSQNTTTGKNMLGLQDGTYSDNGITAVVENGIITINGTASNISNIRIPINLTFNANQSYSISANNTSTLGGGINDTYCCIRLRTSISDDIDTNVLFNVVNNSTTITKTSDTNYVNFKIRTGSGLIYNNFVIKPQIELGNSSTNWEQYTGGNPSPNPDYPQDVQVVSGNNSICINSKNFFNFNATPALNNLSDAGITSVINSDGTITVNGTKTANYKYIKYYISLPAGTYYFSGCPSDGSKYTYSSIVQTEDSTSPQIFDEGNGNTFTLTEPTTITYYPVRVGQNDVTFNNTVFKPIISKAPVTYNDFEKYQGLQTYQVNFPVKNLFDKDSPNIITNKYLDNSGVEIDGNNFSISDYIRVEPNAIYSSQPYESKNACICFYNSSKTFLSSVRLTDVNPNFTTPDNCVYIRSSLVKADINNIQIEKGSKVNRYTPYGTTPMELCKIGNYQDRIYNQNDKWYLEKNIGKVVLDGSETIERISTQLSGYYRFAVSSPTDLKKHSIIATRAGLLMSDKFIEISNKESNEQQVNGILVRANDSYNFVITCDETSSYTVSEFRSWLQNNNILVYYALATPTITEITDSTLVNQLNALANSDLYSTTNINTVASNLLPYIDLQYNVVTPAPSPERPSEIDTLTGDVDYKISGKNLLDISNLYSITTNSGITVSNNVTTGQVILNGTATKDTFVTYNTQTFNIGDTLSISANNSTTNSDVAIRLYNITTGDITPNILLDETYKASNNITLSKIVDALQIRIANGTTLNNFILYPQLEEGSTATSYEPYISQTYQIKLGNIELCKINTYEDKIYSNDGKFYLEKNIGKVVLDGSENWTLQSINSYGIANFSFVNDISDYIGGSVNRGTMCNYFLAQNSLISATKTPGYMLNPGKQLFLRINSSIVNTTETFKTWLSTHNTIIYYALATPTTTEITSDNYSELYESLKQIQDYLVQYKINNEFILDYSSPNIEY